MGLTIWSCSKTTGHLKDILVMSKTMSSSSLGLFLPFKTEDLVVISKKMGTENTFYVCLKPKVNSKKESLFQIVAEVATEEMAENLKAFLLDKH